MPGQQAGGGASKGSRESKTKGVDKKVAKLPAKKPKKKVVEAKKKKAAKKVVEDARKRKIYGTEVGLHKKRTELANGFDSKPIDSTDINDAVDASNALGTLSLASKGRAQTDQHPEGRYKASYKAHETKRLFKMKERAEILSAQKAKPKPVDQLLEGRRQEKTQWIHKSTAKIEPLPEDKVVDGPRREKLQWIQREFANDPANPYNLSINGEPTGFDGDPPNETSTECKATGINHALSALSIAFGSGAQVDPHPERRYKAAFNSYKRTRLAELAREAREAKESGEMTEEKGRPQRKIEQIRSEFEKRPEHPFNRVCRLFE